MIQPRLTVLIPSFNGKQHLAKCLPTVLEHAPPDTQIVVIDDASTDGTLAWLDRTHPQVEWHAHTTNRGFCHAVNTGLQHARGEIVELLNNDTMVAPGWVSAALEHFDDASVGSVAPLVLEMDRPDVIDSMGQDYHICGWAFNRGLGKRLAEAAPKTTEIFGPSGSSGFYRRSVLVQLGGLWTPYGAYFEDTDLAFRLRWLGYRCVFEPRSRVLHHGTATYGKQSDRHAWLVARNEEMVFWANLPWPQLLLGLLPHFGFQSIRVLRKFLSGQLNVFLSGKRDSLRYWRVLMERRRDIAELARRLHRRPAIALRKDCGIVAQGLAWLLRHKPESITHVSLAPRP